MVQGDWGWKGAFTAAPFALCQMLSSRQTDLAKWRKERFNHSCIYSLHRLELRKTLVEDVSLPGATPFQRAKFTTNLVLECMKESLVSPT